MNALIEEIFRDFCVDGRRVPVSFLRYEGHNEPYVTYQQTDADTPLSGDDALLAYVAYYDFDVYAKGNYLAIAQAVKDTLRQNGFVWQPSRSGSDQYEPDTGYYHKTLNFAIYRKEE